MGKKVLMGEAYDVGEVNGGLEEYRCRSNIYEYSCVKDGDVERTLDNGSKMV